MVPSCKASHKCGNPTKNVDHVPGVNRETMGFSTSFSTSFCMVIYPRVHGFHFTTTIGPCSLAVPPVKLDRV